MLCKSELQIINGLVEDEVAFGPENRNPEEIIKLVNKYTNEQALKQKKTLSGGEKQKLITASTLHRTKDIAIR